MTQPPAPPKETRAELNPSRAWSWGHELGMAAVLRSLAEALRPDAGGSFCAVRQHRQCVQTGQRETWRAEGGCHDWRAH